MYTHLPRRLESQGIMLVTVTIQIHDPKLSSNPLFYCSTAFEAEKALGQLFVDIKVTEASKLFMIDSATGTLLANSVPHSIFSVNYSDPLLGVSSWTPTTSNDTTLNQIGYTLLKLYGNYSQIPNTGNTLTVEADVGDGQKWFINTRYLKSPGTWILVVAIPRSDFFSNIDAAEKRIVIISIVIGVLGVVGTAVMSFFALRPLYKLAKAMEQLTKMDFSALEGNILQDRSLISEVRLLQRTFATMCKAFAGGIKKNKSLMGGIAKASSHSTPGPSPQGQIAKSAPDSGSIKLEEPPMPLPSGGSS
ncbi:hypothetical protein HDU76_001611 [Blyttiomyces sp. JEL0837]|nr:hypothetical protein HDU76_001611 [Blyttiomyces sp. JEL0837]